MRSHTGATFSSSRGRHAIAGSVGLGLAMLAAPAWADEPAQPPVSVTINADTKELEPGDSVIYQITVSNTGEEDDVDLTVKLTAPDRARVTVASHQGALDGPTVEWPLTVPAGEDLTLRAALATGHVRDGVRGYPVRACAGVGGDLPLTCATEITQLAGQPDVRTGLLPDDDESGPRLSVILGGAFVAGLAAYAVRHRRHDSRKMLR